MKSDWQEESLGIKKLKHTSVFRFIPRHKMCKSPKRRRNTIKCTNKHTAINANGKVIHTQLGLRELHVHTTPVTITIIIGITS